MLSAILAKIIRSDYLSIIFIKKLNNIVSSFRQRATQASDKGKKTTESCAYLMNSQKLSFLSVDLLVIKARISLVIHLDIYSKPKFSYCSMILFRSFSESEFILYEWLIKLYITHSLCWFSMYSFMKRFLSVTSFINSTILLFERRSSWYRFWLLYYNMLTWDFKPAMQLLRS